jgi:hypothetical protein
MKPQARIGHARTSAARQKPASQLEAFLPTRSVEPRWAASRVEGHSVAEGMRGLPDTGGPYLINALTCPELMTAVNVRHR